MADYESRALLVRSQLWPSLEAIDALSSKASLMTVAGLDPKSLADNVKSLETAVLGSGDLVQSLGACDKIQDEHVKQQVKAQVVNHLVQAYSRLHAIVHDPANNYADASHIIRYTPEQFRNLLENS